MPRHENYYHMKEAGQSPLAVLTRTNQDGSTRSDYGAPATMALVAWTLQLGNIPWEMHELTPAQVQDAYAAQAALLIGACI